MIILAGGSKDHNMQRILNAVQSRDYGHQIIWSDHPQNLSFSFNALNGHTNIDLFNDGRHSMMIRYDVFQTRQDNTSHEMADAWYNAVKGWGMAMPHVALLNSTYDLGAEPNKARNLIWAKQVGFDVPDTHITNNPIPFLKSPENWIIKPVCGGIHTQCLQDYLTKTNHDLSALTAMPWIVQRKMAYPELRVFQVGPWQFALSIQNHGIDSRDNLANMKITAVDMPRSLQTPMEKLSQKLTLGFSAADFKTCPETGNYKFLEINTMPMITGYDNVLEGQLSDALALTLHKMQRTPRP